MPLQFRRVQCAALAVFLTLPSLTARAQDAGIEKRSGINFATPDGAPLLADFYGPAAGNAPVIVAVHGGGWEAGNRSFYRYWGPYLANHGYAVFAIDYRLATPSQKAYPGAVTDVRTAIHYVREHSATLHIDPARVALMGDSAGAQLAALVALTDSVPGETAAEGQAPVKAVILFYGVYDMAAQWHHDQLARPADQITQIFLGASPLKDRRLYFDASPLSHVQQDGRAISFLLTYGTEDIVADRHTQSEAFIAALAETGKYVRAVIVPSAPHFWSIDPIEEPGSYTGVFAPRLLRFLQERL